MKTLVIYYSRSGHTKKVAEEISFVLKCDIEEIKDKTSRKGIWGWLTSGRDSTLGRLTKISDILKNLDSYDMVIIGTPIFSFNVSSPIRTFLSENAEKISNAAFFCTEGGSGASRAFNTMSSLIGKEPVATLEIKERELKGEKHLQKISDFVDRIRTKA
jgi:flavodoxin